MSSIKHVRVCVSPEMFKIIRERFLAHVNTVILTTCFDYVFGDAVERLTGTLMKLHCPGCRIDHPSQNQHICLDLQPDNPLYDELYEDALDELDAGYIKALFLEFAHVIGYDANLIDVDERFTKLRDRWGHRQYREEVYIGMLDHFRDRQLDVGMTYAEVLEKVREKVDLLKERFTEKQQKQK